MIELFETLFFVDGQTEVEAIVQKLEKEFPNMVRYRLKDNFRRISCNGIGVAPEGYANKVAPLILIGLNNRYKRFIIILDREKRRLSAIKFGEIIKNEIIDKLKNKYRIKNIKQFESKIDVCVADIMFENWIIADIEGIKSREDLVKDDCMQDRFDGKHPCLILSKIMKVKYRKIIHSVPLFKAVCFERAKINSPSIYCLLRILEI